MNATRTAVVQRAYNKLDADSNGVVTIDDLKQRYNAEENPDVKMGKKTEEDVLYEFLDTFEQHFAVTVSFGRVTSRNRTRGIERSLRRSSMSTTRI